MSKTEFIKVQNRLSQQLAKPGGMTADIATQRARRELAAQAGDAKKSLGVTIGRMEAMVAEKTASADDIYVESAVVLDIAGMFDMRTLCDASYSLCELTDRLRTKDRQDWSSIGVHVNALRLIWSKDDKDAAQLKSVVDGLWAITDRLDAS